MTAVTIHVPSRDRAAVAKQLAELAGGTKGVRSGTAGLTVDAAVAVAYLTAPGGTAPNQGGRRPVPPGLSTTVREAETAAGVLDPDRAPKPQATTAPRRGRRTPPPSTEE